MSTDPDDDGPDYDDDGTTRMTEEERRRFWRHVNHAPQEDQ